MSRKALTQTIRKDGGLIISEATLDPVALLCVAHDMLVSWGIKTNLIKEIAQELGVPSTMTARHAYYYGRLNTQATQDRLSRLWDERVFNLFNSIAPNGYYFGSHEGDGACIGWFKASDI